MNTRNSPVLLALSVFVAFLCVAIPASANNINLLSDGSFETPVVDPNQTCGGYGPAQCFYNGDSLGPWQLIGKSDRQYATVMLMTNDYQEKYGQTNDPLYFHVHDGNQAIDLTGEGNQNTQPGVDDGIKQSLTLGPGQYELSFWLGHQDGTAPGYTNGPSMISLWINGIEQQIFSNGDNSFHDVTWDQFFYNFSASGYTTIAFINETPVGNNYAGLDDIRLVQTPEPASLLLLASGIGGLLIRRLRK
ncbi:MAG: PEP-CTERM sorting domain-containing protein [Terriglobales bacterium]